MHCSPFFSKQWSKNVFQTCPNMKKDVSRLLPFPKQEAQRRNRAGWGKCQASNPWKRYTCCLMTSSITLLRYCKQIRRGPITRPQAVLLMKWLLRINRNASLKTKMEKRVFTIPITTFALVLTLIIAISSPLAAHYKAFLLQHHTHARVHTQIKPSAT